MMDFSLELGEIKTPHGGEPDELRGIGSPSESLRGSSSESSDARAQSLDSPGNEALHSAVEELQVSHKYVHELVAGKGSQ
jgi:hypothetical protein